VSKTGNTVTLGAALVATTTEAIAVWLIDKLPRWAQAVVYGVPMLAMLLGLLLIALKYRRRSRSRAPRGGAPR
jgi:hypothetical protein